MNINAVKCAVLLSCNVSGVNAPHFVTNVSKSI